MREGAGARALGVWSLFLSYYRMISRRGGCNCLFLKYPYGCWVENGLWRGKTGSREISRRLSLCPRREAGMVAAGTSGIR